MRKHEINTTEEQSNYFVAFKNVSIMIKSEELLQIKGRLIGCDN